MLDALQSKLVDIVFIDTFSLATEEEELKKRQLFVKQMEDTHTGNNILLI